MTFKEIVYSPCGIRYCFDALDLQSGYARLILLESEMMTKKEDIEAYYASLKEYVALIDNDKPLVQNIQFKLQGLRDISTTLQSLEDGALLDDIEFFEIKYLAMLGEEVQKLLLGANVPWKQLDLSRVIQILDPDGLKIGTFYIYDSYSIDLRTYRKSLEAEPGNDELKEKIEKEEERIKKVLCNLLRPYFDQLQELLKALAQLDIFLAKAIQMQNEGFVIPTIGENAAFKEMFHPQVRNSLSEMGLEFQNIDFSYENGLPSTIIGANMGGKTVVLKTLTLCQYLFQFGFAVPATSCTMMLFDQIHFCIGDEQNQQKGLSSFAAEMLRIDNVLKVVESGERVLALVDEPARTTNPIEGRALVSALLKILESRNNLSLILTTHYNVDNGGKCWRVKGLIEKNRGIGGLKMDYSLLRTQTNQVPHEALNIASELGINSTWLEQAKLFLENKK